MSIRIATYNVNGINRRLANLRGWLQEAAPEIVGLQELKAPDDKFPAAALRSAGYGAIWHGQKSWNGVAILPRGAEPVETRRGLPGDPDDTHSRYIRSGDRLHGRWMSLSAERQSRAGPEIRFQVDHCCPLDSAFAALRCGFYSEVNFSIEGIGKNRRRPQTDFCRLV